MAVFPPANTAREVFDQAGWECVACFSQVGAYDAWFQGASSTSLLAAPPAREASR